MYPSRTEGNQLLHILESIGEGEDSVLFCMGHAVPLKNSLDSINISHPKRMH